MPNSRPLQSPATQPPPPPPSPCRHDAAGDTRRRFHPLCGFPARVQSPRLFVSLPRVFVSQSAATLKPLRSSSRLPSKRRGLRLTAAAAAAAPAPSPQCEGNQAVTLDLVEVQFHNQNTFINLVSIAELLSCGKKINSFHVITT